MTSFLDIETEAPPGSFSQYDIAVMLPELQKLTTEDTYVEIGVQYGRSLYIAAKYSKAKVYGVDIEPNLKTELLTGLDYEYTDVGSEKAAWEWDKKKDKFIRLLFIDGDHSYLGCAKDIENWAKFVNQGGVILFHDCDSTSPGVMKAVREYYGDKVETFKDSVGQTSIAKVKL